MKNYWNTLLTLIVTLGCFSMSAQAEDTKPIKIAGPYEVEVHKDIPYVEGKEGEDNKHKLDLFIPKGQKDFPVLFFIHGGGWTTGDRKMYGPVGHVFAKNGIGTVVLSYRLTPQVQHPGHIEDVAKAFAWTHKNIGKYDGKNDQIFVTGQSAGGHLAALLGTNESYLKAEKLSLKDIKGVMPISGIYNFHENRFVPIIGKGKEAAESASPIQQVTGKEPPFLILYADKDFPTCDVMSKNFAEELKKHKVDVSVQMIPERNHITIMAWLMLSESDPATQALLEFVAKHSGLKLREKGK
ncbi:alpha/beta hydrolase [Telmatocola sphagniphila]|uniref:Alpha/beta hydrolase n=1 Tax=Telmatocola sphagniphila TaxID=1123043 RepID=A0A8E6EV41_9BACT|nr:alpha/beta hydrolase [Telmatocola sphagniphila]QVL32107.1 alpha/beta hydrolase [Telmatocola sphagniphila]